MQLSGACWYSIGSRIYKGAVGPFWGMWLGQLREHTVCLLCIGACGQGSDMGVCEQLGAVSSKL